MRFSRLFLVFFYLTKRRDIGCRKPPFNFGVLYFTPPPSVFAFFKHINKLPSFKFHASVTNIRVQSSHNFVCFHFFDVRNIARIKWMNSVWDMRGILSVFVFIRVTRKINYSRSYVNLAKIWLNDRLYCFAVKLVQEVVLGR